MAFLQRHGIAVTPIDNDGDNGGDPADDILNDEVFEATLAQLGKQSSGLIFSNLVDFDAKYGHRRNPEGYARALEAFDVQLPQLLDALGPDDELILTADHGCDPTFAGSDHTREYVPLVVFGQGRDQDLGTRDSMADVAASMPALMEPPM